ncbi:MAG: single-stranded-DNA-specific exonuclease RecJ [Pseudomonadota bacterium]
MRRRDFDSKAATALHSKSLIGRILAARGLREESELELRLDALLRPFDMADYDHGVEILCQAVQAGKRILVVGDYDADGATSTALACHALRAMGATAEYLVPNRFEYGYGLSPAIVKVALEKSPDLILTVDNGIASHDGVALARAAGIQVVVTDHHLPGATLPDADAVVNPNRADCAFGSKNLCGVGVIFYVVAGVCRQLQNSGYLSAESAPRMADYLDLVALGTVADVVPLDRNNRIFIEQGLRRIRAGAARPGLLALFSVASRDHRQATSTDIGFVVGPRLNAAGRLDDMSIGIECLLAPTLGKAMPLARQLDEFNRKRRQIESTMRQDGQQQVEQAAAGLPGDLPFAITVYDPQWHEGVIGILAGRLKEQCHRPVFAFARTHDGTLKGSGRSIAGIHIRDILVAIVADHPDLLSKFGGHAMAAGLSLPEAHLPLFKEAFNRHVENVLGGRFPQREWLTDGALIDTEMTLENAVAIKYLQPWGQSFPAPQFDDIFEITEVRPVGNGHSRLRLCQPGGKRQFPAIAFNRQISGDESQRWHLVYRLDVNTYNNRESLQLVVEHLAPAP